MSNFTPEEVVAFLGLATPGDVVDLFIVAEEALPGYSQEEIGAIADLVMANFRRATGIAVTALGIECSNVGTQLMDQHDYLDDDTLAQLESDWNDYVGGADEDEWM